MTTTRFVKSGAWVEIKAQLPHSLAGETVQIRTNHQHLWITEGVNVRRLCDVPLEIKLDRDGLLTFKIQIEVDSGSASIFVWHGTHQAVQIFLYGAKSLSLTSSRVILENGKDCSQTVCLQLLDDLDNGVGEMSGQLMINTANVGILHGTTVQQAIEVKTEHLGNLPPFRLTVTDPTPGAHRIDMTFFPMDGGFQEVDISFTLVVERGARGFGTPRRREVSPTAITLHDGTPPAEPTLVPPPPAPTTASRVNELLGAPRSDRGGFSEAEEQHFNSQPTSVLDMEPWEEVPTGRKWLWAISLCAVLAFTSFGVVANLNADEKAAIEDYVAENVGPWIEAGVDKIDAWAERNEEVPVAPTPVRPVVVEATPVKVAPVVVNTPIAEPVAVEPAVNDVNIVNTVNDVPPPPPGAGKSFKQPAPPRLNIPSVPLKPPTAYPLDPSRSK